MLPELNVYAEPWYLRSAVRELLPVLLLPGFLVVCDLSKATPGIPPGHRFRPEQIIYRLRSRLAFQEKHRDWEAQQGLSLIHI